jgi:beta-glucosidase
MQELGLDAYRFSIAWPRILPNGRGQVNAAGLDFYDRLVDGLLAAGIEPWATLYHWDLPQALQDGGGWPHRSTADAFAEYTDVVTRRLGDRVKNWITINEPWVIAILGDLWGIHAPGSGSLPKALATGHHLLLAHGHAVEVIRSNVPESKVGITLNLAQMYPNSDREADQYATSIMDGHQNRWFLDPVFGRGYPQDMVGFYDHANPDVRTGDLDVISRPTDFLGINTYAPTWVEHDPNGLFDLIGDPHASGKRTAMDWLVDPNGFEDLLVRVHNDYAPGSIVVTENGSAWDDREPVDGRVNDPDRIDYLQGHLLAAHEAIVQGVPLDGYFAWSLLDNFEWSEGYTKRFGLTYVDYATQERTLKDSGRFYAKTIQAHGENL